MCSIYFDRSDGCSHNHYDSTGLTGTRSPYFGGVESPGAVTRACNYHFRITARALIKPQPLEGISPWT